MTEKDRLKYLKEKIKQLNLEIEQKGLQGEYAKTVKQIADEDLKLEPIYEEEWEIMLPSEQDKNLLAYYHTLRSEAEMTLDEVKRQGSVEKATKWLDNKWVKRTVTLTAIIKVAVDIGILIAHTGLFYREEDKDRLL